MDDGGCSRSEAPIVSLRERIDMGATRRRGARIVGSVALVGAGPGDPDLLTVKAVALIKRADVIVHDRLVAPEILALAPRARRVYVGKSRSRHALAQSAINALLVELARCGQRVVRLKGGDPYIFGRGGEEAEVLAANGVPFEVVPGISAANGIAACTGIPLTHRDHAQTCVFITGHLKDGTMDLDWPALARPHQTLVVYMGLLALPMLCDELVRHGLAATTPAAVIQHGTTAAQRVVTGSLATLPQLADAAALESPTLIIIGDVVALRERLMPYDEAAASASVLRFARSAISVTDLPSTEGISANP